MIGVAPVNPQGVASGERTSSLSLDRHCPVVTVALTMAGFEATATINCNTQPTCLTAALGQAVPYDPRSIRSTSRPGVVSICTRSSAATTHNESRGR